MNQCADVLEQLRDIKGLEQCGVETGIRELSTITFGGVAGHRHYRDIAGFLIGTQDSQCVVSRDVRHLDIHENQAGFVLARQFDAFLAPASAEGSESPGLQNTFQQQSVE